MNLQNNLKRLNHSITDVFINNDDTITIFYKKNLEQIKLEVLEYLQVRGLNNIKKVKFYQI